MVSVFILIDNYFLPRSAKLAINHNVDTSIQMCESAIRSFAKRASRQSHDQDYVFKLAEQHSNIAINYINRWHKIYSKRIDDWTDHRVITCDAKPPLIESIGFNNIYWQSIINTEELTLFLYNTFFDRRQKIRKIRVIGVSDHFNRLVNTTLW